MTNAINVHIIQYIAIAGSVFFIFFILNLIRRKRLKEEYALLWLFFALIFLTLSIWRPGLDIVAGMIGIAYPPAALFLTLLAAMFLILIQFSIVLSQLSEHSKKLSQEIGLLRLELKEKTQLKTEKNRD